MLEILKPIEHYIISCVRNLIILSQWIEYNPHFFFQLFSFCSIGFIVNSISDATAGKSYEGNYSED